MPTYDYVCGSCSHAFEHFQSMTSDLLTDCPECAEPKLKRLIGSGSALIFKGSGFYETDYKRKRGGDSSSPSERKSDSGGAKKKSSPSKSDSSD